MAKTKIDTNTDPFMLGHYACASGLIFLKGLEIRNCRVEAFAEILNPPQVGDIISVEVQFCVALRRKELTGRFDLELEVLAVTEKNDFCKVRATKKIAEVTFGNEKYYVCWSYPALGGPAMWFAKLPVGKKSNWQVYWEEYGVLETTERLFGPDQKIPVHPQAA